MLQLKGQKSIQSEDRRLLKLIGALGKIRVSRLVDLFEGESYDIPAALFRLRASGQITWVGSSDSLSSNTAVSLPPRTSAILEESELREMIRSIIAASTDMSGWAFLGAVGNVLKSRVGDVDYTQFGFNSLYRFLQEDDRLEFDERGEGAAKAIHVRVKNTPQVTETEGPDADVAAS